MNLNWLVPIEQSLEVTLCCDAFVELQGIVNFWNKFGQQQLQQCVQQYPVGKYHCIKHPGNTKFGVNTVMYINYKW